MADRSWYEAFMKAWRRIDRAARKTSRRFSRETEMLELRILPTTLTPLPQTQIVVDPPSGGIQYSPPADLSLTPTSITAFSSQPPVLSGIPDSPVAYLGTEIKQLVPDATISDPGVSELTGITIQVTGHYQDGWDVLVAGKMSPGISSSFDPSTGTLTLSGIASLADYQAALRAVTYHTNTAVVNSASKTFTITINNDSTASEPVTVTLSLSYTSHSPYAIASLGDSLTFWPNGWISKLNANQAAGNITDFGVGGYTTEQIYNVWETQVRHSGFQMISVLGGVNDIAHGVSAKDAFAYLNRIYDEAMADGLKVVVYSMTPIGGWHPNAESHWTPAIQTQIELFNSMIEAKAEANPKQMVFCDAYKLMGDPSNPEVLNPQYDNGDGLHWNLTGHQIMASAFYPEFEPTTIVVPVSQPPIQVLPPSPTPPAPPTDPADPTPAPAPNQPPVSTPTPPVSTPVQTPPTNTGNVTESGIETNTLNDATLFDDIWSDSNKHDDGLLD